MDKLTSMHVYCRVVELRSFVAAAREMGLSTTMVSKHVAWLEKVLGVRILNRTTRKVDLTEAGTAYYHRCKQILADLRELESSLGQAETLPQGLLRVNAPIDFGSSHLIHAIDAYQQTVAHVAVELVLENRQVDLIDGGFDIVIRVTDVPQKDCEAYPIAQAQLCTYASPAYLKAHGEPRTLDELEQHRCLHFLDTPHGDYWIFREADGIRRVKPQWRFASNNGRALCRAAALGMGVIRVPDAAVSTYVSTKRLQEILAPYRPPALGVYAYHANRRFLPVKIASFIKFLGEYFATHRLW